MERQSPLYLSSTVVLTPGMMAIPDLDALTNQNRRAMLVDEIRFSLFSDFPASPNGPDWLGQIVRCQLLCANFEVTRDLVPIWSFGQTFDQRNEEASDSPFGLSVRNYAQFFRWVLPRPLYVPAGVTIIPKLQLAPIQSPTTITDLTVSVGYAGCEIDELPEGPVAVPFVGAFIRDSLSLSNGFAITSDEKQLVNPFDVPLNVQRFSLRGATMDQPGGALPGYEITNLLNCRMWDSNQNDVIQIPIEETGTFALPQRTWTVPGVVLQPHDYYTALIQALSAGASVNTSISLSMIGWREENY